MTKGSRLEGDPACRVGLPGGHQKPISSSEGLYLPSFAGNLSYSYNLFHSHDMWQAWALPDPPHGGVFVLFQKPLGISTQPQNGGRRVVWDSTFCLWLSGSLAETSGPCLALYSKSNIKDCVASRPERWLAGLCKACLQSKAIA